MSQRTYARTFGVMVSLAAPAGATCDRVAGHIRDAGMALEVGGLTVGEWLELINPHGGGGGSVYLVVRDEENRSIWARFVYGGGCECELVEASEKPGVAVTLGVAPLEEGTSVIMTILASIKVDYTLMELLVWVKSWDGSEDLRLERSGLMRKGGRSGVVAEFMEKSWEGTCYVEVTDPGLN